MLNYGIGQGYLTITPLQTDVMTIGIAKRGVRYWSPSGGRDPHARRATAGDRQPRSDSPLRGVAAALGRRD